MSKFWPLAYAIKLAIAVTCLHVEYPVPLRNPSSSISLSFHHEQSSTFPAVIASPCPVPSRPSLPAKTDSHGTRSLIDVLPFLYRAHYHSARNPQVSRSCSCFSERIYLPDPDCHRHTKKRCAREDILNLCSRLVPTVYVSQPSFRCGCNPVFL